MPTYRTVRIIKDFRDEITKYIEGEKVRITGSRYKAGEELKLHIRTAARFVRQGYAVYL